MNWIAKIAQNSHSLARAWEDLVGLLKKSLPAGVEVESALKIMDEEFELPLGEDGQRDRIILKEEDLRFWENKIRDLIKKGDFPVWVQSRLSEIDIKFN